MKKIYIVLSILILCSFAFTLFAKDFNFKQSGLSLWLPDNWIIDNDKENDILIAKTKDEEIFFMFWSLKKTDNLDDAMDELEAQFNEVFDDFEIKDQNDTKFNNLKTNYIIGHGIQDDEELPFGVLIIDHNKTFTIVVIAGTEDGWSQHSKDIEKIGTSIKPLNKK